MIRLVVALVAVFVLLAFQHQAGAQSAAIELTVSAGDADRQNTPVKAQVQVPEALAGAQLVRFEGHDFVGQLSKPGLLAPTLEAAKGMVVRELHFVLPELAAGKTLQLKGIVADSPAKEGFVWSDTPGKSAELRFGDRPVLCYMYEAPDNSSPERRLETYKPYHHVYDPEGKRLVTKGPGGLYTHHRGLFYGFNRISYGGKSADTWHCNRGESQSHEGFLAQEAGPVPGRHLAAIDWHGQDGAVFAKEQREMAVYHTPGGLLVEFASRLASTVGEVKLDGDPQHAGFQFRASQDVPDKTSKLTYYLRPDGKGEPGKFRNWSANGDKEFANLPWNALSFVLDDERLTCCYLDRPQNPKEARFSERDYGRFGSYFEYTLTGENRLDISYRIWLQQGEMTVEQVDRLSRDFVNPPVAKVAGQGR
jgi:hypothetical protein